MTKIPRKEYINRPAGTYPWLQDLLKARMTRRFNTIILFVGSAGIGKSYGGMTLGEEMDPTFNVDRVTFTPTEFLDQVSKMKSGQWIMIDEPALSGILGKRTWYQEMQQALVDVLETFRYLRLGLILCCINRNLLDTNVRNYLLHYMVWMRDRGFGTVYGFHASQFDSSIFTPFIGYALFELPSDELIKAYEDKRHEIQSSRYMKSMRKMEVEETKRFTFKDILDEARERIEELRDEEGKISIVNIRLILGVGRNRAYDIKKALESEEI